jgi:hypothetical protein
MTSVTASTTGPSAAITEAGSPDHMIKFIISIAMLVGGLQISQSLGGQAGGMAGKGMAKLQKMGSGAMKSVGTGLKRATGVERVQMAYKAYQDTKASERSVRSRDDALAASRAVGSIKKTIIAEPYKGIKDVVTQGQSRKAEKARAELAVIKDSKTKYIDDLAQGKARIEMERSSINTTGKRLDGSLVKGADKDKVLNELSEKEIQLTVQAQNSNLDYKKLGNKDYIKTEKEKALEPHKKDTDIIQKEAEIKEHEEKQARNNRLRNKALGIAGMAVAPLVPGHFAMELLRGKQASMPHISRSGDRDLNRAANYNSQKISTKKDELKYASKEKLMEAIKTTSDHH